MTADPAWRAPGQLADRLATALGGTLPGPAAQLLMAPSPRPGWRAGVAPDTARPAGALLLLYGAADGVRIVLTRRTEGLPTHQGQISLPGGACHPGEAPREAALREVHEELGVPAGAYRLLGCLTPLHIPISGFLLHPFVAVASVRPRIAPAPREVAGLLEPTLERLADPAIQRVEVHRRDGRRHEIPLFDLGPGKVWGATAMILAELLALLGVPPHPAAAGETRP